MSSGMALNAHLLSSRPLDAKRVRQARLGIAILIAVTTSVRICQFCYLNNKRSKLKAGSICSSGASSNAAAASRRSAFAETRR